MKFEDACVLALEYFENNVKLYGLAAASEDNNYWYFSGGKDGKNLIGNIVISISKNDGKIEIVDILLDEVYERLSKSKVIELS